MLASLETPETLDVLFVDLPFNTYELGRHFKAAWAHKRVVAAPELHLGFRYMTSRLRKAAYSADILFPAEEDPHITTDGLITTIVKLQPMVLGFTSYEGSLNETMRFIRRCKQRGVRSFICIGGHLATFSYEDILRDHADLVDAIVIGEGEATIVELTQAIKDGSSHTSISGIAYVRDGLVFTTPPRRPAERVGDYPFPIRPTVAAADRASSPLFMITSRGCYAHCSFCRASQLGDKWRPREPTEVVDEIEEAYRQGWRIFEIVDDNFLGPGRLGRRRAVEFAKAIAARRLRIQFHASCRVNDVDASTMAILKDAGLCSISLGVESGVQRMLDSFDKGITPNRSREALHILRDAGIRVLAYIIFFDPYSTLDEVDENVEFIKELYRMGNVRFEDILYRRLIPVSGTQLFETIRQDGLLRGNYLRGHHFVFKDRRISWIADLMERIDLRFERALQRSQFSKLNGLYSVKEALELLVVQQATSQLRDPTLRRSEFFDSMNKLIETQIRAVVGGARPPNMVANASDAVSAPT